MSSSESHLQSVLSVGVDPETGRCSRADFIWNGGIDFTGSVRSEALPFIPDEGETTESGIILPTRKVLGRIATQLKDFYDERARKPTMYEPVRLLARWAVPDQMGHQTLYRAEIDGQRAIPLVSTQPIDRAPDGSWNRGVKRDIAPDGRLETVHDALEALAKVHREAVLEESISSFFDVQQRLTAERASYAVDTAPKGFRVRDLPHWLRRHRSKNTH